VRHTFSLILATGIVSGCAGPQKVAGPSPEFAPVIPVATEQSSIPTGSVYNVAFSDSWFGEKKAYRVGDIVTVVLDESVDADTTTKKYGIPEDKDRCSITASAREMG